MIYLLVDSPRPRLSRCLRGNEGVARRLAVPAKRQKDRARTTGVDTGGDIVTIRKTAALAGTAALALGLGAATASAQDLSACLITKTDTNPFFVKMKEGATAKADELGIELSTFAGRLDGDVETQVAAVETC